MRTQLKCGSSVWVYQGHVSWLGNRLSSTDLYRVCSLCLQKTGRAKALLWLCHVSWIFSVCLEAQIRMGEKKNQEFSKFFFAFFLSSILSVYVWETKGMRLAWEQHKVHNVPWNVDYQWAQRQCEVGIWCWTLWWISVKKFRSGWKHLEFGILEFKIIITVYR